MQVLGGHIPVSICARRWDGLRPSLGRHKAKGASQNLPRRTNLDVVRARGGLAVEDEAVELEIDDVVSGDNDRPDAVQAGLVRAVIVDIWTGQ